MDVYSIESDYIPVVTREGQEGLHMADRLRTLQRLLLERDSADILPRLREAERTSDDKEIQHHIGTVFRHRRWGYVGVIKRWDPRCCADELWIQGNNVDSLDNDGRRQPFYSISADDGSDRYIAQINVVPMKTVHVHTINKIVSKHEDLGLTFSHAVPEKGIFVLEPGHRLKYPEDAAWQDEQLKE
jgi:hemimethylated DNA binding protein